MEDTIRTRIEDGIGVLSFNKPDVMNAVEPRYLLDVIEAFVKLDRDPQVRAIVITGEGKAFCAGAERSFLQELRQLEAHQIRDTVYASFQGLVRAIKFSDNPTVAAVNGPAIGAGCEFALAADLRVTTPKAFFCENWIDLGILPPLGGMFLLPRLIGLERATNMVLRAQRVSGEEAARIGLASECVDPEALLSAAMRIAAELGSRSRAAIRFARLGLRRGMEGTLAGEWEFNVQAQAILLTSPDFKQASAALQEQRKPVSR